MKGLIEKLALWGSKLMYADVLTKSKRTTVNSPSEFVPVQVKKSVSSIKSAEPCVIRLILKNGIECILPDGIESKRIKEVVEVLVSSN